MQGAPETIQEMLIDLPSLYVETYKKYTRQGSRVLALAYKSLPEMAVSEARSLERDSVESALTFAGFAVMITGDQALTACHVANQVHIISKPALILSRVKDGRGLQWISPDESESIPYSNYMNRYMA
ncbi:putative manganese-transporting ATPase pdr2 [Asimina triloba]